MDPAADGSAETPTVASPNKTFSGSVHVWLRIFLGVWVISFFLPAVNLAVDMGRRPARGWEIAWVALVLSFVPVKGMWLIAIPGVWLVWMNLFMLIAPFEIRRIKRGQGRVFAVLFSLGTVLTMVIVYVPDLSSATGLRVGFYLWAFSLIATAGMLLRTLWRSRLGTLPAACLVGLLVSLPIHRGEIDFLPKTKLASTPAETSPVRVTTTKLVASSPNPSLMGSPVTLTAQTSAIGGDIPSGTVGFLDGKVLVGKAHTTAGVATVSTNGLKTGAHFITATFAGDASTGYLGSASPGLTQIVNDPKDIATQTVLSLVEQHPEQTGERISFTLRTKVSAIASTTPVTTGEVILEFMHGFKTAVRLNHEGEATFSSVLPTSVWRGYKVQATYGGGDGFQASVSTLTLQ
jgi:hypothetical protein